MNAAKTEWQDENEFGEQAGVEKQLAAAEEYTGENEQVIKDLAAKVKEQWDAYQANPEGYFDTTDLFILDTMIGGKGLNDISLVTRLAEESAGAIEWMGENDMIKELKPEIDGYVTTNAPGIQGEGIVMAQEAGADVVDMDQIQLHPTVHVQDGAASLITEGLRGDGAILVNQEGKRFFDEVSTRDKVSAAENEQTGGFAWLIVDQKMLDASNVIKGYVDKGWTVTGETAEDLAAEMDAVPPYPAGRPTFRIRAWYTDAMQNNAHTHTFRAFNTVNAISVAEVAEDAARAAFKTVEQRCAHFERLFSHTLPESSLVRVNRACGEAVEVEPELAELVQAALGYCEYTGGLFDITMGPVVALWDFHQGVRLVAEGAKLRTGLGTSGHQARPLVPSADALSLALEHVDWRAVHVNGQTVWLEDPQASIVLGGVAKGYIADELVALLQEQGIEHGIVNLGGNVAVFGGKPSGEPWSVGLRMPRSSADAEEDWFAAVQVENGSVVTSGIYERCFTAPDGTFYHHILDPRNGLPATTDLASVSLISERSIDGDGYTTALVIMGLERARAFVEGLQGCEAVFVTSDNKVYGTSGIGKSVAISM